MPDVATLPAGRELDALVAEKVMGATWDGRMLRLNGRVAAFKEDRTFTRHSEVGLPLYSTDFAAAWLVVEAVQKREPGWRFCLLGGDRQYGYGDDSPRRGVDRSQLLPFGWHAEYFGHVDPAKNYGNRHGEAYAETPALAICRASLAALGAA